MRVQLADNDVDDPEIQLYLSPMRLDFSLRRIRLPTFFRRQPQPASSVPLRAPAMEYPIVVNTDVFREEHANFHQELAALGKGKKWNQLIEKVRELPSLVNSSELGVNGGPSPPFRTPLHHAAGCGAPENVLKDLIELGASRCMKTEDGKTAYDLAEAAGRDASTLELLAIPEEIKKDQEAIDKMEAGLHSVINGRVEDLIKKNGQRLPQLAVLFELAKDCGGFYYPVPGMYGGFNVSRAENGIQADSWIRICGGSEQNHFIDRDGKVTLLPNDDPL